MFKMPHEFINANFLLRKYQILKIDFRQIELNYLIDVL